MTSINDVAALVDAYAQERYLLGKADQLATDQLKLSALTDQVSQLTSTSAADKVTIETLKAKLAQYVKPTLFGAFCGADRYPNTNPTETKQEMRDRINGLIGPINVERIFNVASWTIPDQGHASVLSLDLNPNAVASGQYDSQFRTLFDGIVGTKQLCKFTINHEADNNKWDGPSQVAALKHLQIVRDNEGISEDEIAIGPILMSSTLYTNKPKADSYQWAGQDFRGFDCYIRPNTVNTAEKALRPIIDYAKAGGVPLVIGEFSMGKQGGASFADFTDAQWSTEVASAISILDNEDVAAVCWFYTKKSDGDWRLTPHPNAMASWKAAATR
jgi:hypothetical protein